MTLNVGIIDYAITNLASVINAFHHIGVDAKVVKSPQEIEMCSHLVLPGVGSFVVGMANLKKSDCIESVRNHVWAGKPLIGMCLGMQLLADEGEEFGVTKGLGLIPGRVTKMKISDVNLRLPHVGWNELSQRRTSRLLVGIDDPAVFYFVHSYCYADYTAGYVTGICDYGGPQVGLIEEGNIFGAQFHPEKSQKHGLALLKNFISIAPL